MAAKKESPAEPKKTRRPPATTPESRENQLIALAVDLAARQLEDGTASAQVMTHYLKLGSSRERLEQQRIEMETSLIGAKMDNMASAARVEELYSEAIAAMRRYAGQEPLDPSGQLDD